MRAKIKKIDVAEDGTIEIHPENIIHVEPYEIENGIETNKDGTIGGIIKRKGFIIYYLADIK